MEKLISIILPTYNRAGYLEYTLNLLKEQVKRNAADVELIICNNASTDNTAQLLIDLHKEDPYFSYMNYEDHVDIGPSIKRSVDNATGKYVLMWSDDDTPCSMLVDMLVRYVKEFPDLACIHFNGMNGTDDDNYGMRNLVIKNKSIEAEYKIYDNFNDFAERYWLGMGVMSSDLFLTSAWKEGRESVDSSKHYGWDFLFPILYGIKGKKCMYVDFPLWIQRDPKYRSWQSRSAYYWMLGIPNLLSDLEKYGIIRNFREIWYGKVNSMSLVLHLGTQMTLDKAFYKGIKKDIMKYQEEKPLHRLIINLILYCFPTKLYKFLRERHFRK